MYLLVSETSMGVQMDALHNRESDYVKSVFLAKDTIFHRMRSPWLWNDWIFNLSSSGRKLNKAVELMQTYVLKVSGLHG